MEWWTWILVTYGAGGLVFAMVASVRAVREGYDSGEPGDELVMSPLMILLWLPLLLEIILGRDGLDVMEWLREEASFTQLMVVVLGFASLVGGVTYVATITLVSALV